MDLENIELEDENIDYLIENFCNKINADLFKKIYSAKEIRSNFESMNEILEPLNETKIFYENPELKITKTVRTKIQIITPKKDLDKDDENLIKDIKCFQAGYEESAEETIKTIDNVKKNFSELSKTVNSLIEAIELTKKEYFETIKEMMNPIVIEYDKVESIDKTKFSKGKLINYNDMKEKIDIKIKVYDEYLAKIIKDKKEILRQINDNIKIYINLLNSLDEPINTTIEKMENVFDIFEEKSKIFINIVYNYRSPEEKKQGLTLFREIQKLNSEIILLFADNIEKLKKQNDNIKDKKNQCSTDLQKIRVNNLNSSEKLANLHEETQIIMKDINNLLKFLNLPKEEYNEKKLKGLQLFNIQNKIIEGTEEILKANQKIEIDFTKLKKFIEEKNENINKVFTLDLAFIMDITGSMGSYLQFAKEKILTVINKIMEDTTVIVKLGFVGYRDYLDNQNIEYIIYPELTKDIEMVKNFIKSAQVGGGGDCEDMTGGLNIALNYKWKSRTRFAMLIADMPCHGIQYHGQPIDSYPNGDTKYKIDEIVEKFASKNVNLFCINIKNTTEILYNNFKNYYKKGKKSNSNADVFVKDFKEEPEKLADIIVQKAKEFYEKRHETTINDDN